MTKGLLGAFLAILAFICGLCFSNFYPKDSEQGFSFRQNLYHSSELLPDSFVSMPSFSASSLLSTKINLSLEERGKITKTFNDIIALANENKICKGGSYSIEPTFYYDKGRNVPRGHSFRASFDCEISAKQLQEYNELINNMAKLASLNGLIVMNTPALSAVISSELLRKNEQNSISEILKLADEARKQYSKATNKNCYVKNIDFVNNSIVPRPLYAAKSNSDIVETSLPVIDSKKIEKTATVTFYCE